MRGRNIAEIRFNTMKKRNVVGLRRPKWMEEKKESASMTAVPTEEVVLDPPL